MDQYEWVLAQRIAERLGCSTNEVIEFAIRTIYDLIAEARIAKETIRLGSLQQAQAAMMDRPVCSSCKGTKFVTVELKHSKVNEPCPKCHPDFKNESQPVVQKPTLTHNPFSKVLKRDDS